MKSIIVILALYSGLAVGVARAADEPATAPAAQVQATISLDVVTEDNQPLIRATVKRGDKLAENVSVAFYVRRTFGNLLLGEDKTLDDGTAAVKFPAKLPGDSGGHLQVLAVIHSPADLLNQSAQATFPGGIVISPNPEPFPRAFWAPRAPMALVATICILLAGVWTTYAFVVSQIVAIRKEGREL